MAIDNDGDGDAGGFQPEFIPPPGKSTRRTNQLDYIEELLKAIFKHKHSWPFAKPVDAVKLNLLVEPVRNFALLSFNRDFCSYRIITM